MLAHNIFSKWMGFHRHVIRPMTPVFKLLEQQHLNIELLSTTIVHNRPDVGHDSMVQVHCAAATNRLIHKWDHMLLTQDIDLMMELVSDIHKLRTDIALLDDVIDGWDVLYPGLNNKIVNQIYQHNLATEQPVEVCSEAMEVLMDTDLSYNYYNPPGVLLPTIKKLDETTYLKLRSRLGYLKHYYDMYGELYLGHRDNVLLHSLLEHEIDDMLAESEEYLEVWEKAYHEMVGFDKECEMALIDLFNQ